MDAEDPIARVPGTAGQACVAPGPGPGPAPGPAPVPGPGPGPGPDDAGAGISDHGGRVRAAAARWGIPVNRWLDLSTGINPQPYPVRAPDAACWQRLPEGGDALLPAAAGYYGTAALLPVPGTQAALMHLPALRPPGTVTVLHPAYAEHAAAWARAGHAVSALPADVPDAALLARAGATNVLVLVHPNNPTGRRWPAAFLRTLHARLAARGGVLVVDEAFLDCTPGDTLLTPDPPPGLVVLCSVGKFFGLAGARVGFVCADAPTRAALAQRLGPWAVAGPSRAAAAQALADSVWQAATRARLTRDAARLRAVLHHHGLSAPGGCELFAYVPTPRAAALHGALARRGILTRLFDYPPALRLGLPGTAADWQRLDAALRDCGTTVT